MQDPLAYKIVALAGLGIVAFFIVLFSREPWWRAPFGRSFMALVVAIFGFEVATSLRLVLGDEYMGRQAVRFAAQILSLSALVACTVELLRERRKR